MSGNRPFKVFVAIGGHAFARDAFEAMVRAIGVQPCFVDQPSAAMLMNPDGLRGFEADLLHDMPFTRHAGNGFLQTSRNASRTGRTARLAEARRPDYSPRRCARPGDGAVPPGY